MAIKRPSNKNYVASTRTWGGKTRSETKEFSELSKAQKFAESGGSGYVVNRKSGVGRMFEYMIGWRKLEDYDARSVLSDMEREL